MRSSTPRCVQLLGRALARACSPKVASGSLPPSSSTTLALDGSKRRKSSRRLRVARARAIWPASSTPVGPAPTIGERQPARPLRRGPHRSRPSRRRRRSARRSSSASSIVFMPGRVQRELVVTEVGLVDAGRDDQAVVGDLAVEAPGAWRARDLRASRSKPVHLGQLDPDVLLLAQRRGGSAARSARAERMPGRDLVEQRLEEVVVAAVDQRDVDRPAAEEPGGGQAAEAAADDHDAVAARRPSARLPLRPAGARARASVAGPAHASAEHVEGPALVEQHDREAARRSRSSSPSARSRPRRRC